MFSTIKPGIWIVSIHLLFWLLLTALLTMIFNELLVTGKQVLTGVSVNIAGHLLLVYGHLLFLLPRFFDKKKYRQYVLGLILLLTGAAFLRFCVGFAAVIIFDLGLESNFTPSYFRGMFFSGVFFLLITIPLRLIDNWFKKRALEKELRTQQLEAELRFLKAQVNPHFLFNALNNIYALSFTESKKTPEMILKLSGMMSYMLYDCKNESVRLSDEIEYLKNYIDLQQLKKDGEQNIDFNVIGIADGLEITPMLFIPFFENAFKHGNLNDTENGWLKSFLKIESNRLHFQIRNSLDERQKKDKKGGVGLENIDKRLELIYPQKHQLSIEKKEDVFSVDLEIEF